MNKAGKHPHRTYEVLLVEDNPADSRLVVEGLKEVGIRHHLHCVRDGAKALDFLYRRGAYADEPRPDVVLLDLNLPGISGFEVLDQVKSDPDLKSIPILVLTSSHSESDISRAYEHYANCYVVKPADFDSFLDVIELTKEFWMDVAEIP